ncbi:ribosome silencing factor [Methylobacterium sp. SD274]|uniref:ribosome silencing factor n=1 Tax=unclassified Methylobacterium TaxID=2615210 RepID=UPI0019112110|nr:MULTISPECIES: ribosome silencing factor [unclassified Methylobacterium]MBO1020939.1 ribosome silencing factor [Methylobacterium sp. SD274]
MTAVTSGIETLTDSHHSGATGSDHAADQRIGDLKTLALDCLEDMKAEETIEIDLAGRTSLADTMIITSGRSQRHVSAIADRILQEMKSKGFGTARVEGMPACDWVLIDTGDIIVHIFRPEVRGFYNLEKMWGADRPTTDLLAG